ncbi:hypothetical protein [Borreliella burgdorferi]|uniref:hypothetical protein n=1 Tax=Borreliella burgdorferi TaxID=139 RepID=UPI00016B37C8|nr:hypothetical protein [Borreliella burgdorferi]
MNLINKLFILTILFSSVISCKLYKKITYNADQVIDKLKSNNGSFNTLKSNDDSKRSGRKPRSVDNTYMDQDTGKKPLMADMQPDMQNDNSSSNHTLQVNIQDNEASEARNIMTEIESSKEEYNRINEDLAKVKANLDKIKSLLSTAKSYLEQTRRGVGSSKANLALLPSLEEAIAKVKSNHASADTHCNDAIAALKRAKNDFEYAQRKAYRALEEALSNSNASRHESYYYAGYHQFMADAKASMSSTKSLLEVAKNKQKELNENMTKTNKDFQELNDIYKKLQDMDSR